MTRHLISQSTLNKTGETADQWFRRIARDKPGRTRLCQVCGQDHRCPREYWPEGELARHHLALQRMESKS